MISYSTVKKYLVITVVLLTLCGCNNDSDIDIDNKGIKMFVESGSNIPIGNVHLFCFNSMGRQVLHKYYPTLEELTSDILFMNFGVYNFIQVFNVNKEFADANSRSIAPTDLLFYDFIAWLKGVETHYPDMMTAVKEIQVTDNTAIQLTTKAHSGTESTNFSTLRLALTFPNGEMPEYTNLTRSGGNLRAVIEVYKKGITERIHSCTQALNDKYINLNLYAGEYDILLWVDAFEGNESNAYYVTDYLSNIKLAEQPSHTVDRSNRDAFHLSFVSVVTQDDTTHQAIALKRPLAKYNIVTTDLERYIRTTTLNNYTPIDELTATISYDGYFQNSFDVRLSIPTDSHTGVKYSTQLTESSEVIASDYLFTKESGESFVTITIVIADKSGKKISQIPGVRVRYRRGYISTISSEFLTAGVGGSGIVIDTDWGGVFDVNF